jgi:polyphosphate:AMP phosphotransferase
MFEAAELGIEVDRQTWDKEAPVVREALLQAQRDLAASKQSLVILVSGVEGAGKREVVNFLLEWMDARGVQTHVMRDPSEEELERPEYWRFWRRLPPAGRTAIFLGSWYSRHIIERVYGECGDKDLDQALDRIVEFERMLSHEGVILAKLWCHLSRKQQKNHFRELEKDKATRWRVTKEDWKYLKHYDEFRTVSEHALRRTSLGEAPWHIIEASDPRHRNLTVARTVIEAIRSRLDAPTQKTAKVMKLSLPPLPQKTLLSEVDHKKLVVDRKVYETRLLKLQGKLNQLVGRLPKAGKSLILVFEGPDAAGKGGTIRRLTAAMEAGFWEVAAVAAPTDEERSHPYLWRFWRNLPRRGRVTLYDRSWYGRVLVERVEGFAQPEEWQRAYGEINSFEEQLAEHGNIIVKFWLAISQEEQLRRFKDRQTTPFKQYKITEEDWRNRAKWDAYEQAACDMFEKTSTQIAPWVIVEANDKLHARLKVLKAVNSALKEALD